MVENTLTQPSEARKILPSGRQIPKYLLREDIEEVIKAVSKPRDRLFLKILWMTGLRVSEAISLTPSSFSYAENHQTGKKEGFLTVKTLKQRKVRKKGKPGRPAKESMEVVRVLPVKDDIINEVYAYCSERLAKNKPIGAKDRLFPFNRITAYKIIQNAFKKAWKNVCGNTRASILSEAEWMRYAHPHTFRHSFAINCVRENIPLQVIKTWMGHRDIQSTEIYSEIWGHHTHEFMDKIQF